MIKQFLKRLLDTILPPQRVEGISLDTFLEKTESARRNPPDVRHTWLLAPLRYRNPLAKEVVRALKYKGSTHAATLLAHALHPLLMEYISDAQIFGSHDPVLLVPIPLSKQRLRERGYNQASLLARALQELCSKTDCTLAEKVLVRIKNTPSQTKTRSRQERFENIAGCFRVPDPKEVTGKTIVLIDDVTTTGATMYEARKTLLTAGCTDILCLAASH